MSQAADPSGRPERPGVPARTRRRRVDRALPGDTTVGVAEGVALLLGLAALSGWVLALALAGFAVLFGWLVTHSDPDLDELHPPFGGSAG